MVTAVFLSVSECMSFSVLKPHTNVRTRLSVGLSVRSSGLFKKAYYSVQLWFG